MNLKGTILTGICASFIAGCATLATAIDFASNFAANTAVPSNVGAYNYVNNDQFSRSLAGSFAGQVDEVRVNFDGDLPNVATVMPSQISAAALQSQVDQHQLVKWNSIILLTGGQVIQCQLSLEEAGLGDFLQWALNFASQATNAAGYLLAKDYHSIVYTSANDPNLVDHVVFKNRASGPPSC